MENHDIMNRVKKWSELILIIKKLSTKEKGIHLDHSNYTCFTIMKRFVATIESKAGSLIGKPLCIMQGNTI